MKRDQEKVTKLKCREKKGIKEKKETKQMKTKKQYQMIYTFVFEILEANEIEKEDRKIFEGTMAEELNCPRLMENTNTL